MATETRTTLPGSDYFEPEVFELDRERIFFRHWYYLGRADDLAAPGDYVAVEVAGESIVVVRAKDETLHGFYNVCRHRGSRLCDAGSGHMRGAIKCPYHAWTYSFDGRLIGTPLVAEDEVDRASLGLWPVVVDTWAGFLFVTFAESPPAARRLACRAVRVAAAVRALRAARRAAGRPPHGHRRRRELEDPRRELQRVPPLPDGAPRAGRGRPGLPARRGDRAAAATTAASGSRATGRASRSPVSRTCP